MGNKVVIVILVVITLILVGAGVTWFKNTTTPKSNPTAIDASSSPQAQASGSQDTRMALKDLFSSAKNQKCTFSDSASGSSGIIYISDGQMRGDFTNVSGGQTVISHLIVQNNTSYVWTDASDQGVKMSYEKVTQLTSATASTQTRGDSMPISLDQKVSYQCSTWTPEAALLTLPSTVKFNDFSSLLPQIKASGSATGSGATETKNEACQACEQLSGSAREQCRKALSC